MLNGTVSLPEENQRAQQAINQVVVSDAYADFAPSTVKPVERLDRLATSVALARAVGFNPVMIHRLHHNQMSSPNGTKNNISSQQCIGSTCGQCKKAAISGRVQRKYTQNKTWIMTRGTSSRG